MMSLSNPTKDSEPIKSLQFTDRTNPIHDTATSAGSLEDIYPRTPSVQPGSMKLVPETLKPLANPEFYSQANCMEELCEVLFKLKRRGATIQGELYFGLIHYISCLYILAVVPQQLQSAGYDGKNTCVSVALVTGAATIFCGLFANLPFVLAPPTVVSIFLSGSLQQNNLSPTVGSTCVIFSGLLLVFFGWRPIGQLAAKLVPQSIQIGTAVGIGLLTALAGSTEIDLIVSGQYTIVEIGYITPEIMIALAGVIIISVAMYYHVKGSFCLAVILCSLIWWSYDDSFPRSIAGTPHITITDFSSTPVAGKHAFLIIDLIFLYVLYLNGLMTSLSNLAVLTRDDATVPRGRWVYIMCGIFTIISGCFSSAPILISPESSASIKAGAKTGLSAVVCGVLFLLSTFFAPLFQTTPAAGTSPVLIMIGIILFQNSSRVDWRDITVAVPAFIVLFYIPFTYSVIQGVIIGYNVYILISLFTGELPFHVADSLIDYFPSWEEVLIPWLDWLRQNQAGSHKSHKKEMQKEGVDATGEGEEKEKDSSRRSSSPPSMNLAMNNEQDRESRATNNIVDADLALRFSMSRDPSMTASAAGARMGLLDFGTDLVSIRRSTIAVRPRRNSANNLNGF